jgi:hypothetical protein
MRARLLFAAVLALAGCGNAKRLDARPGVPTSIALAALHARGFDVQATPRRDGFLPQRGLPDDVLMAFDRFGNPHHPPTTKRPKPNDGHPSTPTHL